MSQRSIHIAERPCVWPFVAAFLLSTAVLPAAQAQECVEISTPAELQAMEEDLNADYCLVNDIDMSGVANFRPIAGDTNTGFFEGSLDGRGHVIRNLHVAVTDPEPPASVGLFGKVARARVSNIRLEDAEIRFSISRAGSFNAGVIAGHFKGEIENCSVTGSVTNTSEDFPMTGGLVGYLSKGSRVSNCTANVVVEGHRFVGGLVGYKADNARIDRSSAAGRVTGGISTGGLVGHSDRGVIRSSYATGPVAGRYDSFYKGGTGGLIGTSYRSRVRNAFATGEVRALNSRARLGGLIGYADDTSLPEGFYRLRDVFALGPVRGEGDGAVGGLVGRSRARINKVYAAGAVTVGDGAKVGGLTGVQNRHSRRAYWDIETTGQPQSGSHNEKPRTTQQLQHALPELFDPADWAITPDVSYPYLLSPDIDFAGPLAAVVRQDRVYVFVPIAQRENVEYEERPDHPNQASRAAVYTMVARAIGFAEDIEELKEATIDDFWDDDAQDTSFSGEVTDHAELGELTELNGNIGEGNIIGLIRERKVVALRGLFGPEGDRQPHWMLATSFTVNGNGTLKELVANDPRTGKQVRIDPETRRVVSPENFPLEDFRVADYQSIAITSNQ